MIPPSTAGNIHANPWEARGIRLYAPVSAAGREKPSIAPTIPSPSYTPITAAASTDPFHTPSLGIYNCHETCRGRKAGHYNAYREHIH